MEELNLAQFPPLELVETQEHQESEAQELTILCPLSGGDNLDGTKDIYEAKRELQPLCVCVGGGRGVRVREFRYPRSQEVSDPLELKVYYRQL